MTNKAQDIKEFFLCSLGFQVIFFCLLPFSPRLEYRPASSSKRDSKEEEENPEILKSTAF